jgi:hypothetical protein
MVERKVAACGSASSPDEGVTVDRADSSCEAEVRRVSTCCSISSSDGGEEAATGAISLSMLALPEAERVVAIPIPLSSVSLSLLFNASQSRGGSTKVVRHRETSSWMAAQDRTAWRQR